MTTANTIAPLTHYRLSLAFAALFAGIVRTSRGTPDPQETTKARIKECIRTSASFAAQASPAAHKLAHFIVHNLRYTTGKLLITLTKSSHLLLRVLRVAVPAALLTGSYALHPFLTLVIGAPGALLAFKDLGGLIARAQDLEYARAKPTLDLIAAFDQLALAVDLPRHYLESPLVRALAKHYVPPPPPPAPAKKVSAPAPAPVMARASNGVVAAGAATVAAVAYAGSSHASQESTYDSNTYDDSPGYSPIYSINPATGLQMINDAIDIAGNVYGCDNTSYSYDSSYIYDSGSSFDSGNMFD